MVHCIQLASFSVSKLDRGVNKEEITPIDVLPSGLFDEIIKFIKAESGIRLK